MPTACRAKPCDASVVNGTREGVLVFAFVVDFRELIVFKNRKPRLMRRAGNTNFLCHRTFPSGSLWLSVHAARSDGDAQETAGGWDGRITRRSARGRASVARSFSRGGEPMRMSMKTSRTGCWCMMVDPIAESLWPSHAGAFRTPAGPFDLQLLQRVARSRQYSANLDSRTARAIRCNHASRKRSSRLCVLMNPILPGAIHRDHAGEIL